MTKNTLLNIAIILSEIIKIGFVFILITLTAFFVHLQIDKDYYNGKELQFNTKEYHYSISKKWKVDNSMDDKDVYTINNLNTGSLYLNYLKYAMALILAFISVREFQKVIKSVKHVETFGVKNVKSFKRIGVCLLVYSIIMSYSSMRFKLGGFSGFGLNVNLLILVLVAFIMAEIFKEGNSLKQENDLTI